MLNKLRQMFRGLHDTMEQQHLSSITTAIAGLQELAASHVDARDYHLEVAAKAHTEANLHEEANVRCSAAASAFTAAFKEI